jgi:hypothetical protein
MSGRVRLGHNGMAPLPTWAELEPAVPAMVATMRPLLDPDRLHPTPRSVTNADITLRSFAAFLVQAAPDVRSVAEVTRRHVEDYKPFLSERSGQNKPSVRTATLAHRLGTLRMSFVRIDEWGWDEAPVRMPMFPGDRPRRTIRCPRALDDPAAARLLRAAQNDRKLLVRVTVEVLLRTGPSCSPISSVVYRSAGPPVGPDRIRPSPGVVLLDQAALYLGDPARQQLGDRVVERGVVVYAVRLGLREHVVPEVVVQGALLWCQIVWCRHRPGLRSPSLLSVILSHRRPAVPFERVLGRHWREAHNPDNPDCERVRTYETPATLLMTVAVVVYGVGPARKVGAPLGRGGAS